MKFAQSITATAVLSLFALGNAWAEDAARNYAPIFGDVHTTPGQEVITPYFKLNHTDADGYPDSINISFKVFTAGTTTLRRQTEVKTIPTPAIPAGCLAADAANNFDIGVFVTRRAAQLDSTSVLEPASKRMAIAVNMNTECDSNPDPSVYSWAESFGGFVYSADLSGIEAGATPGPAWYKSWPGKLVEGLNGVDVDGDLVNDFQLITTGAPTATGWSLAIAYAASKTGVINTTITTSNGTSYTLPTSGIAYPVMLK